MPILLRHACEACDFEVRAMTGRTMYAVAGDGRRVVCQHPGELHTLHEVTGLDYGEAVDAGRAVRSNPR